MEFVEAQRRLLDLGLTRFLALFEALPRAEIEECRTQMQLRSQQVGRVCLVTDELDAAQRALTGVGQADDQADDLSDAVW